MSLSDHRWAPSIETGNMARASGITIFENNIRYTIWTGNCLKVADEINRIFSSVLTDIDTAPILQITDASLFRTCDRVSLGAWTIGGAGRSVLK